MVGKDLVVSLHSMLRHEYRKAQSALMASFFLVLTIYILTIFQLFSDEQDIVLVAVIAFAAQSAIVLLRANAEYHLEIGNRCRYLSFLQNGLGQLPTAMEVAELSFLIPRYRMIDDREYFSSNETPGPRRLIELVGESAYFTSNLSRVSARLLFALAGTAAMAVLISFILAIRAASDMSVEVLLQALLLSLSFWLSGDMLTTAYRYRLLAQSTATVSTMYRPLHTLELEPTESEAHALLAEYLLATAHTPPIPGILYRLYRNRLNRGWNVQA